MLKILKNFFTRPRDEENDKYNTLCATAIKRGCSPEAAELIQKMYRRNEIAESDVRKYIRDLEYCNDPQELIRRFVNEERPEGNPRQHDRNSAIIGAIYGDIIGSRYEGQRLDSVEEALRDPLNFRCAMTDDSITTIATLKAVRLGESPILRKHISPADITRMNTYPYEKNPFTEIYKEAVRKYPDAGYGGHFYMWGISEDPRPYGSCGNGAAMRVSPIGALLDQQKQVITFAFRSAMTTHNHIEGVKGAIVTAMCIWMARTGYSKRQIFEYMKTHYSYGTILFSQWTYEEARQISGHQMMCQYSVPAAVISFMESSDFTEAIAKAACAGLDTDTNACICGGIAGAYYGVDDGVRNVVRVHCERQNITFP